MTKNPALAQLKRVPVIIVLTLMMLLAGLLLLERTGPAVDASRSARLDFVNTSSADDPGTDFNNPGGNPEKHCTDGHGRDDEQNKHCRGISGAR
jgi:hypothetical protein